MYNYGYTRVGVMTGLEMARGGRVLGRVDTT